MTFYNFITGTLHFGIILCLFVVLFGFAVFTVLDLIDLWNATFGKDEVESDGFMLKSEEAGDA